VNRAELVTAIKSYLNRPNLPAADVTTMIASVEGELNRELREHPRNLRRTTYTQPADKAILPLPTDIAQMIELRDSVGRLNQYPPSNRPLAQAMGRAFVDYGDCVELFPTPGADTEYNLNYIAFLRPLQADLDFNWVSTYYSDLYLYGALKEAAVYLKDDARLAQWQGEFVRRLEGVKDQGWNQNIQGAPAIRLILDE
jgi:hypothetical protein